VQQGYREPPTYAITRWLRRPKLFLKHLKADNRWLGSPDHNSGAMLMDVSAIAAAATDLSQATTADQVQLVMLKKALSIEAETVAQLVTSAVQAGQTSNPPHLGNGIDTFV
jgi:hypothetical protein